MCPQPPDTPEPVRARRQAGGSRHATPVFVDRTGRRGRRVTGLGALATLPALAFAGTLAFSAVNAPPVDRPSLPAHGPRTQTVHGHLENAAEIGAREPARAVRGHRPALSTAEVTPAVAPARDVPQGRR